MGLYFNLKSLDYFELLNRQKAIERIEEDCFIPASYNSSNNVENLIKTV